MDRHFDIELVALKEKITLMGGYVEKSIEDVTRALVSRDRLKLQNVQSHEDTINQLHMQVDQTCVQLLARQSPLASDLRLIVAIIKINADLERMGDQAMNVSHNTTHYLSRNPIQFQFDFAAFTQEVKHMVRMALDSFMRTDLDLAHKVLKQDDSIDKKKNDAFRGLVKHIEQNPSDTESAIDLILIARNLERIGDHATNIAEDVIFLATGEDIRHGGRK